MTCSEFQSLLDEYESLSDEQKLNMTLHTAECESCRNDLDFMLSVINVTKNLPPIKAPDNFISELNKRIDLEEIKQKRKLAVIRTYMTEWKRYGAVAACLLLAVVVGFNGKSLVSDMTNNGNGIITEEVTTFDVPKDVSQNPVENSGSEVPTLSTDIVVPKVGENRAEAVNNAALVTPAVKATAKPVTKATAEPKNNSVSTVKSVDNVAVQTQEPTNIKEQNNLDISTPSPAADNEAATASVAYNGTDVNEPYTLQRDGYKISQDSVEVASVNEPDVNSVASGYVVASDKEQLALGLYTPLDMSGNPTDYDFDTGVIADSPIVDSILVSSEDEAVVRDLISRYITGNYGMYYMSTEDKLNRFFDELDKAGISYEKFLKSSTNRISFKLVVIS